MHDGAFAHEPLAFMRGQEMLSSRPTNILLL